jgi:hypothetical protein
MLETNTIFTIQCIATLSPHDREPATTMSRLKEAGTGVASAGRKLAGGS